MSGVTVGFLNWMTERRTVAKTGEANCGREEIMKLIWNVLNLNCSQDLRRRSLIHSFHKYLLSMYRCQGCSS